MDLITQKRIDKLDALGRCPVCGASAAVSIGGRKARKVYFECGAILGAHSGQPIAGLVACPAPSDTAALLLESEIVEADHLARTKAGAA